MGLKNYLPSKNEFIQKIMILKQQIFFKTHALICKSLRYMFFKSSIDPNVYLSNETPFRFNIELFKLKNDKISLIYFIKLYK